MIEQQCTLARAVEISGVGLFLGRPVRLRCVPASVNSGILFVRTDLPGRPSVPATIDYVPGPQRWTGLRNGKAEVRMVEHLMAALCGLGIDNLVIDANAAEMPAGDGSAQTFTTPFIEAGLKELDAPRKRLQLNAPLAVVDGEVTLTAVPQSEGLTATYVLDYGEHFLRCQCLTMTITRETFAQQLAPARTYVLRPEVDAFIKMGLGKGATPENTIVLEENGEMSAEPRFRDECVRHKILDMIGDLYLAGAPVAARCVGYKSGHTANVRLAKAIADACAGKKSQ